MNPRRQKLQLGESWVVEGDDEDDEDDENYVSDRDELSPAPQTNTPPRYPARFAHNQPLEPELVMPSLDAQSIDGSWADRPRNQNGGTRSSGGVPQARRRIPQSNSGPNPEKRLRQIAVSAKYHNTPEPRQSSAQNTLPELRDVLELTVSQTIKIVSWLFDVVWGALVFLKKPLSFLIAIWLLFGVFVLMRNFATRSIYSALTPICRIPGISFLNLPLCPDYGPAPPVDFDQVMDVQSKFGEVLEETTGRVWMPLDLKSSEISIRDLRQLVEYSQLPSK